jgi:hypothetical protein
MLPIEAIIARLESIPGMTGGTNIFGGTSAVLPTGISYLTVADTGGRGPWGPHSEKIAIRRPSFQITAHAPSYLDAAALAEQAFALLAINNMLIGDVFFLSITPRQEPFALPLDASQNNRLAFNIDTERRL